MLSITQRSTNGYPEASWAFSPGAHYPEYPFDEISQGRADVYEQVRETFRQCGLDSRNFGRKEWNPLGGWVLPGQKVFILCNFVQERRVNQSLAQLHAKCSHGSVLRALCDYVLIALKGTGEIVFGNAPLQSTEWDDVQSQTGAAAVQAFYQRRGLAVRSADLRMVTRPRSFLGHITAERERPATEACVDVDLSQTSLLRALKAHGSSRKPKFRVMDYDHRRTEQYQSDERHVYVVSRELLQSNVVISLPKLKTHEKVGITCGLKGFVGMVGQKDCLAHHRFGAQAEGGDEYPYSSRFRRWQSGFHDALNSGGRVQLGNQLGMILDRNLTRLFSRLGFTYGGAWHGNDTCWRMALDLAHIAHYADANGCLRTTAQRQHLCLIDGIIAGEGKGPLSPSAVPAGVLIFSDNVALADAAACKMMGYNPECIPLVREGCNREAFPFLVQQAWASENACCNGTAVDLASLEPALGRSFLPSPGWKDWLLAGKMHATDDGHA